MFYPFRQWGIDDDIAVIRIDSDPEEPARVHRPAVSLVGDAAPILRRLLDALPAQTAKRPSRQGEMGGRHARVNGRFENLAPQLALLGAHRGELPDEALFFD